MKVARAIDVEGRAVTRLCDAYSQARSFSATSDQLNELVKKVFDALPPKTPRYVHAFLRGYSRALTAELYHSELIFGGLVDDKFYSTHSNRDDYYQKHGIEPSAYADNGIVSNRGHYWARTLKPFFIST
jgi:hypothetical protein